MSLTVNSGPKALYLYFTQPFNAVDIDDDSTTGTLQVVDNSIRDDLQSLKVWISETSGFTPAAGNLVFDAGFQSIVPLTDLKNNTTYYIKYAFVSKIDPEVYTTSAQVTATTLDTARSISGYLNRDPIQIPTDTSGNNPDFTNATGTFIVYSLNTNVTGTAAVTYSVVNGSSTGGITATIANTGVYTITGITDLVGTITLRAVYTNPQDNTEQYTLDIVLNVSKLRPGATAPVVSLTSNGQVFIKAKNNGTINPSSITFNATEANVPTPQYAWYLNNQLISGATGNEYTLNSFSNALAKTLKVVVSSGVAGNSTSVFDQLTVYYLEEGSDGLAVGLVNENQTISLNAAGTVLSGLPIVSELFVYRGSTLLTNANSGITYSLVNSNGLTGITINSTTGIINITGIDTNIISGYATFQATVGSTTLSKKLTINVVQDGQPGISITWKGSLSSAPASPQINWAYYNTTDKKSYIYNGTAWTEIAVDGADGKGINYRGAFSSPPASPQLNDTYRDTDNGIVYIYNGASWVLLIQDGTTPASIVWKGEYSSPPANPQTNWVYRDTDDGIVYIYDGSVWATMTQDGADSTVPGSSVEIQWSADGSSWHANYQTGDLYIRQRIGTGAWSAAVRVVGEDGQDAKVLEVTGYSGTIKKSGNTFTPSTVTLTATPKNFSATYSWSITGGTPSNASTASVTITPDANNTSGITATVIATETTPVAGTSYTKTITFAIVSDGAASTVPGASAVRAYIIVNSSSMPSPTGISTTTGWFDNANKVPNTGAASTVNTWYDQPPSTALAANQWLFQLDGTKTAAGVYSWDSTPYLSSFKVGALTAISANIGTFTTTTTDVGQTIISGDQIIIKSWSGSQYVSRVIIGNLSGT